jgi:TldD protein
MQQPRDSPRGGARQGGESRLHDLDEAAVAAALDVACAGALFADLFAEERATVAIAYARGSARVVAIGREAGVAVRSVDKHYGVNFAASDTLAPGGLGALARAVATRSGGGRSVRAGRAPQVSETMELAGGLSDRVRLLDAARAAALAVDESIDDISVSYRETRQNVFIAASDRPWGTEARPQIRVAVQVAARRKRRRATGFEVYSSRAGFRAAAEGVRKAAKEAAAQAVAMLDATPVKAGEMDVVVASGYSGALFHELVGHGLEADAMSRRDTLLAGQLGKQLAGPELTAVDRPWVDGSPASAGIDDEGEPTTTTTLVEQGVVRDALYDRVHAARANRRSTGNGRRGSFASPPAPRMRNLIVLASDANPDDVICDTQAGLLARRLGAGQVDAETGEFMFGVSEGYLIDHGRVVRPISGAIITGRADIALRSLDAVCNDVALVDVICGKHGQGVPVGSGGPTIRLRALTVGGGQRGSS